MSSVPESLSLTCVRGAENVQRCLCGPGLGCEDASPSEWVGTDGSVLGCPSESLWVRQQCLLYLPTLLEDHLRDGQYIGSSNEPGSAKGLNFVLPIKR